MSEEDERDRTLWCGNLDSRVSEEMLYELFLQAGPLEKVKIAFDQASKRSKSFSFITFKHAVSVPYTVELLNGMQLFDKSVKLQYRPGSVHASADGMQNTPSQYDMTPPALNRSFSAPSIKEVNGRRVFEHNQDERTVYNQSESRRGEERRRSGSSREREYRDRSPQRDHGSSRERSRDRERPRDRDRASRLSRSDSDPDHMQTLKGMQTMGGYGGAHANHMQPRYQQMPSPGTTDNFAALMTMANRLNEFNQSPNWQHMPSPRPLQPWQQQGYRGNF